MSVAGMMAQMLLGELARRAGGARPRPRRRKRPVRKGGSWWKSLLGSTVKLPSQVFSGASGGLANGLGLGRKRRRRRGGNWFTNNVKRGYNAGKKLVRDNKLGSKGLTELAKIVSKQGYGRKRRPARRRRVGGIVGNDYMRTPFDSFLRKRRGGSFMSGGFLPQRMERLKMKF